MIVYDFRVKRAIKKRGPRKDRAEQKTQQTLTVFTVPSGKRQGATKTGHTILPPGSVEVISI